MSGFADVLLVSLLPAGGNLLGVAAGEWIRLAPRAIGMLLHAAAGIAIAVVSIDLFPRVLPGLSVWILVPAFALGAVISLVLARGVKRGVAHLELGGPRVWMVYLAIAADLLSDGLMIGIGLTVSTGLGVLLGFSQLIANVPGGFAASANLRAKGAGGTTRLIAAVLFPLPVFLGAIGGYWLLRDAAQATTHAALVFVAGVLLLATIEDIVPEADEPRAPRWTTTLAFTAGFVFFALLALAID